MLSAASGYLLADEVLNVVGDQVRVLVDSNMTNGTCCVMEVVTEPGNGPPLHRHNLDDEYFYIVEGTMRFVVDGIEYRRSTGESILARRNTIHSFCNVGRTPSRMIVSCTPGGLEQCFRTTHRLHLENNVNPSSLAEAFRCIGLDFVGPPLSHSQSASPEMELVEQRQG